MYIRAIELLDLKAFRKSRLEFLYPGRKLKTDPFGDNNRADLADPRFGNINVILGSNGSGKSTVLDAAALAMLSPIPQSWHISSALIRRSNRGEVKSARIVLELVLNPEEGGNSKGTSREMLECKVLRQGNLEYLEGPKIADVRFSAMFVDRSPAFLTLGYGVFRRVESLSKGELLATRQKRRTERYDRVATLFEDDVALIPLSSWFPTVSKGERRDEIVRLINRVTPSTVRFAGKLDPDGEMLFAYRNLELPFSALSDGYRGHLGWIGDMLCRLNDIAPAKVKLTDIPGVVLVDEIDAHLHPAWQREIIGALSRAFPKLQFIFTTHSPLITGTLERANINVVSRKASSPPVVEPPAFEMYGLSSDQILRTDLFGLDSTRDEDFQNLMTQQKIAASHGDPQANSTYMSMATIGKAAFDASETFNLDVPEWLHQTSKL